MFCFPYPLLILVSHVYQAWGAGRSVVSVDDKKEVRGAYNIISPSLLFFTHQLKRARKEGRLAEAMLDRRSKLKR